MITFILSIAALVLGYLIYGKFVEKKFGVDPDLVTPAIAKQDGVDFVPMNWKKIFLIQFLNIAGLGPIFGAIAGALWGPIAFIWIVLGCIFAVAFTITFQVCFRYVTEELVFLRLSGNIWEQVSRNSCVFFLLSYWYL